MPYIYDPTADEYIETAICILCRCSTNSTGYDVCNSCQEYIDAVSELEEELN